MKEQWRQQMQQKMADYRQPAPDVSWSELNQAMAARKRSASMFPVWSRRIAASIAFLLLSGAGYWIVFHQRSAEEARSDYPSLSEQVPSLIGQESLSSPLLSRHTPAKVSQALEEETADRESFVTASQEDTVTIVREDTVSIHQVRPTKREQIPTYSSSYPNTYRKPTTTFDNRLTARLYLSNGMAGGKSDFSSVSKVLQPNGENENSESIEQNKDPLDDSNGESTDCKNGSEEEEVQQGARRCTTRSRTDSESDTYRDVRTDEHIRHHQPIRIGLQLRYQVDNRWSIETGLTYTRLNADITRTTDGQSVELEQALTYLGIPLQASYLIWGYRRFSVYVSAGALVEKMVDGKRTMQGRKEKVSIHPLQVSLNSAVGAEYRFVDWLSLFAEPGLSYSFDNGSSIPTIYQETPLNFNLNLGFRFNIK